MLEPREEMSKELKTARNTLLWTGIIMFVMDMIVLHAIYGDRIPTDLKNKLTALSGALLAAFVALYVFAKKKPKLCIGLGLALFWGLQLWAMSENPDSIKQGILMKIIVTVYLVKGLKSATRAEVLRDELGAVFE